MPEKVEVPGLPFTSWYFGEYGEATLQWDASVFGRQHKEREQGCGNMGFLHVVTLPLLLPSLPLQPLFFPNEATSVAAKSWLDCCQWIYYLLGTLEFTWWWSFLAISINNLSVFCRCVVNIVIKLHVCVLFYFINKGILNKRYWRLKIYSLELGKLLLGSKKIL